MADLESSQRSSRGRVPEPDCVVEGCGREQFAVRRECDGVNLIRMPPERLQRSSSSWVPEPDCAIGGCGRDQLAVRRERDRPE
jgi:hypothetical protein